MSDEPVVFPDEEEGTEPPEHDEEDVEELEGE